MGAAQNQTTTEASLSWSRLPWACPYLQVKPALQHPALTYSGFGSQGALGTARTMLQDKGHEQSKSWFWVEEHPVAMGPWQSMFQAMKWP